MSELKNELTLEEIEVVTKAARVLLTLSWSEKSILDYFKWAMDGIAWQDMMNEKEAAIQDVIDRDAALTRLHEGLIEALEETNQLVEENQ